MSVSYKQSTRSKNSDGNIPAHLSPRTRSTHYYDTTAGRSLFDVILSEATASQSEAVAQSKDPLLADSGGAFARSSYDAPVTLRTSP